ncbi:MAG: hypothetical protein LBQ27_05160 [Clostridiales bacterium]|jgi:hypothetical protein|nr:hypothetical protein [Clostridiales bacterium]
MGKFNWNSTIGNVLKDETAVAIVERYVPDISQYPVPPIVKYMSLKSAYGNIDFIKSRFKLNKEQIDCLIAELWRVE